MGIPVSILLRFPLLPLLLQLQESWRRKMEELLFCYDFPSSLPRKFHTDERSKESKNEREGKKKKTEYGQKAEKFLD